MQKSKVMEDEGNQKLNNPSAVRKLEKFFDIVFGGTAKEVGGIVEDWAKFYRYKNLLKIQDKVEKIIDERNLTGKTTPLPRGLAIEIIESSSKEEDDNLQNLWAGLIANSTDSSSPAQIKKVFLQVLKSMDPIDAKILSWFKRQGWNNDMCIFWRS